MATHLFTMTLGKSLAFLGTDKPALLSFTAPIIAFLRVHLPCLLWIVPLRLLDTKQLELYGLLTRPLQVPSAPQVPAVVTQEVLEPHLWLTAILNARDPSV
jgi:hypothetical protein